MLLFANDLITLARGLFQALTVADNNAAPPGINQTCRTQIPGSDIDASAPRGHDSRDDLLREGQFIAGNPIMSHQEPGAEPLFNGVEGMAENVLGLLRPRKLLIPQYNLLETAAALELRAKNLGR